MNRLTPLIRTSYRAAPLVWSNAYGWTNPRELERIKRRQRLNLNRYLGA